MNENQNNPMNGYPQPNNEPQQNYQEQPAYQPQPTYQAPPQPQQPYQQPPFQQDYQQQVPAGDMPSQGLYLVLMIIGFFLGVLWGCLSISPYKKMKAAIAANDSIEAKAQAKKILTIFIIGVVVNVLFIVGRLAGSM